MRAKTLCDYIAREDEHATGQELEFGGGVGLGSGEKGEEEVDTRGRWRMRCFRKKKVGGTWRGVPSPVSHVGITN
jgi:hypothetical protein